MTTATFTLDPTADFVPTPSTEGTWTHNDQIVAEGISYLIELFRNGPRNQAELTAYLEQFQELEDVIWSMRSTFDPDLATGRALSLIGALYGEPRLARLDDEYRTAIRARMLANRSDGKAEQLIAIVLAVSPDVEVWIDDNPPSSVTVTAAGDLGGSTLATLDALLQQAKAGGHRLVTVVTEGATEGSGSLMWAESDAVSLTTGWGSDTDSTLGGAWTSGA